MINWTKYILDGHYWFLCSECMVAVPELWIEDRGTAQQIHEAFHDKVNAACAKANWLNVIG